MPCNFRTVFGHHGNFCTETRNHGNFLFLTWSEVPLHVACHRARVCVHIHRTYPPSTDVFPDILIFCRRTLAAFGITHHDPKSRAQPSKFHLSINRAHNKRESNRVFKLRATPLLFQSENQSQNTTQKNGKIAAAKHATPPRHQLPPGNVKTSKTLNI